MLERDTESTLVCVKAQLDGFHQNELSPKPEANVF